MKRLFYITVFILNLLAVSSVQAEEGVLVSPQRVYYPSGQPGGGAGKPVSASQDSMSVDSFVNKLAHDIYPEVVREIVDNMRQKLGLDLTPIQIEQWVYNTTLNSAQNIEVRKTMDEAIKAGLQEVTDLKGQNIPTDEIPHRIYDRIKGVLRKKEAYDIIFQEAKRFIEPIIGQHIPD